MHLDDLLLSKVLIFIGAEIGFLSDWPVDCLVHTHEFILVCCGHVGLSLVEIVHYVAEILHCGCCHVKYAFVLGIECFNVFF